MNILSINVVGDFVAGDSVVDGPVVADSTSCLMISWRLDGMYVAIYGYQKDIYKYCEYQRSWRFCGWRFRGW